MNNSFEVLNKILQGEHMAIKQYQAYIGGLTDGPLRNHLTAILTDHKEHATRISYYIQTNGGHAEEGAGFVGIMADWKTGPKGIGALFVRNGTNVGTFLHGGSQERGRRSGTENVASIVGLGKAVEVASKDIYNNNIRVKALRDRFVDEVLHKIPKARLNGHPVERLSGNANISFEFVKGKSLLSFLDDRGISVSSGSACSCGSFSASHVFLAMNLPEEIALGSLRFTFGDENTENDVDVVVDILSQMIEQMRVNEL